MPYDDNQTTYAKYLQKKCMESSSCSCSGSCTCKSSKSEDCGCCPAGLVSVEGPDGKHIACLTPNDAELYNTNNRSCLPGYVMLFKEGTPDVFLGCVKETEFAALYAAVNTVAP